MSRIFRVLFISIIAVGILASVGMPGHANALSGSDFAAGKIIDDSVFYDSNSMSIPQIQTFLSTKVPTCDTYGQQTIYDSTYGDTVTRQVYSQRRGISTPFICLKDYSTTTSNIAPESSLCNGYIGVSGESAATIIYKVAQSCGISPKVILTTIQKESTLVTDSWPWPQEYQKAMGAYCPDTAPCNSGYSGFFNQVYYGARSFRLYTANPTYFNYVAGRNNTIYFNPGPCQTYTSGTCSKYYGSKYDANGNSVPDITYCGSTSVYIQNQSTANLYIYTPYQPNAAALSNLYGLGDVCSSYGNRNFWTTFNDWFGSTQYDAPYAWTVVSQEAYLDSAMTIPANTSILGSNQIIYMRVKARNIGNTTWQNSGTGAVRLGTSNPQDRTSAFCDPSTWLSCNRPASLIESSVAPGDTGTFQFTMKAPTTYGNYKEYFNLLAEGTTWMNDVGMYWPLTVKNPTFVWTYLGQNVYADAAMTKPISSTLAPNTTYYLQLQTRNMGNATWTNSGSNPINLGTSNPQDRTSAFCNASWLSCNRPTSLKESTVTPGQVGTFQFSVTTPGTIKNFQEYFRPVVEGVGWMNDLGTYWQLNVSPPTYTWQYVSQSLYQDSARTMLIQQGTTISNGSTVYTTVKARNIGNTTWQNSGTGAVRLGTSNPQDRTSAFCDPSTWLSCNRPASLIESSVAPGDTGTFQFTMKAPYAINGTNLSEYFNPLAEGVAWMNNPGMYFGFNFNSPANTWQYVSQEAFSDSAMTQPANLGAATKNTVYYLRLHAKNTSGVAWTNSGSNPINLGTSNPQDRTSAFCNASWLSCNRPTSLKESTVTPGQVGTFQFSVTTPGTAGTYNEYFTPLTEGQGWMTDVGLYWQFVVN